MEIKVTVKTEIVLADGTEASVVMTTQQHEGDNPRYYTEGVLKTLDRALAENKGAWSRLGVGQ